MSAETETLLTRAELAERWRVSERWIKDNSRKKLTADPIPFKKLGHRVVRYDINEVTEWLDRRLTK